MKELTYTVHITYDDLLENDGEWLKEEMVAATKEMVSSYLTEEIFGFKYKDKFNVTVE